MLHRRDLRDSRIHIVLPNPNGACVMTTATKTAATSQQCRELSADELALVTGGTSSVDPEPKETLVFNYAGPVVTYTSQKP
jgi:hypothetical protein